MKKYKRIKIKFINTLENFIENEVEIEIKDNTLYLKDALNDERIFPLNNIFEIFLESYKDIPKEL